MNAFVQRVLDREEKHATKTYMYAYQSFEAERNSS